MANSPHYRAVVMRPISGLRLHGAGDRAARSPAPGALPREEPLLPRMETMLGVLASLYWVRGSGHGCSVWEDCVLEPAMRLICGSEWSRASVYGPFLLVEEDNGSTRVFVNVSAGLLEARRDTLERYRRVAEEAASPRALPRDIMRGHGIVGRVLQELIESGLFVPRDIVLKRIIGLALEPGRKAASYGLIYSQAWIDPRAVGPHAVATYVALFAECSAGEASARDEYFVGSLGPRSAPVSIALTSIRGSSEVGDENQGSNSVYLVTSNQPLDASLLENNISVVHPLRPPPQLELHASAYASQVEPSAPRRTHPLPALWPGTIVLDNHDELDAINTYRVSNGEVVLYRSTSLSSLERVVARLSSLTV